METINKQYTLNEAYGFENKMQKNSIRKSQEILQKNLHTLIQIIYVSSIIKPFR